MVSVYPKKGNHNLRKDLYPRIESMEKNPINRCNVDINSPRYEQCPLGFNHCVPLLKNSSLLKWIKTHIDIEHEIIPKAESRIWKHIISRICGRCRFLSLLWSVHAKNWRDVKKNVFFFLPKAIKDKCWYNHSRIFAIIP